MTTSKNEDLISDQISAIIDQAQAEGLQLTGQGGLLPGMIKQAVEAALHAEMTDHLGYEKHDAVGRGSGNPRNGTTPKTVQTTAGPVPLDVPRDRGPPGRPLRGSPLPSLLDIGLQGSRPALHSPGRCQRSGSSSLAW